MHMRTRDFNYLGFVTIANEAIVVHHTSWSLADPRFIPEQYGNPVQTKISMAEAVLKLCTSTFGGGFPPDGRYRLEASGDILLEQSEGRVTAKVRMSTTSYSTPKPEDIVYFKPYFDEKNVGVEVLYEEMPA
jgi:hypothetical protein